MLLCYRPEKHTLYNMKIKYEITVNKKKVLKHFFPMGQLLSDFVRTNNSPLQHVGSHCLTGCSEKSCPQKTALGQQKPCRFQISDEKLKIDGSEKSPGLKTVKSTVKRISHQGRCKDDLMNKLQQKGLCYFTWPFNLGDIFAAFALVTHPTHIM